MAVTSGSYTVGSGGDYSTWKLAIDAFKGQTLDGDLTFTQISDVTETTQQIIQCTATGYRIKFTSNNPPYGDPTKGWKTTKSTSYVFYPYSQASGTIEVCNINLNYTHASTASYMSSMYGGGGSPTPVFYIHDCVVTAATTASGIYLSYNSNSVWAIWNVVSNCGISRFAGTSGRNISNVTIINGGGLAYCINVAAVCQNCYCTGGSTTDYLAAQTEARKNASGDGTTGSPSMRNISAATALQSTDPTSSRYLDIRADSPLWQAGVAYLQTGQTKDVRGRKLPNNRGRYSVGACTAWDNQIFQSPQSK